MILLHSRKALFIRVRKTGSSSIASVLRKHMIDGDVRGLPRNEHSSINNEMFRPHVTASEILGVYGNKLFSDYFTFAFVRNPWDRILSRYFFLVRRYNDNELSNAEFKHWYSSSHKTDFDTWCLEGFPGIGDHVVQLEYLVDTDGRVIVDFVGRFENLQADAEKIFNKLDIQDVLPHRNKTEHPSYLDFYTEETKNIVSDYCKRDIDFFKYQF